MENEFKGRVIFSDNYKTTIDSIKLINKSIGNQATITKINSDSVDISSDSDIRIIPGYKGISKVNEANLKPPTILSAYDESILELISLEGKVRCIAHCAVIQTEKEYIPAAYVTLKFYTKSNLISAKSTEFSDIIIGNDINSELTKEYIKEREFFLSKAAPSNSLMFIDGPMFSGAATSGNFILINDLLSKKCRPIFFVKNSESTIITERFDFAKGYNSDLHWAYSNLKEKEISPVFAYTSKEGRSKAMCFMKIYNNRGPVRIEFPLKAFEEGWYGDDVFDQIYYQFLANGSANNMQTRIIQISEIYAREILKSTNIYKDIERMGLTKSMNEERGF
ncbi:DNA double-strand break repair nuclease NurA [Tenacibaculum finnmarkense genomovar ulcerans]|uniref:DNA double-strand break repair nuclease NurA n=1 Tax=Tenacibaculum finnmarkense TaxID=2781243 RepID=UPI001E4C34B5|nr:DNA double-strand break repair nuclease NurA [Tenacibaculum finnmarkense]MCD8421599.1 DNA double-strand break repair nuclease NurA [Tenacibaculum finnmarkense genomovar ulcerans]